MEIAQNVKQRAAHIGRSNWFRIAAIMWAGWASWTVHDVREDIDSLSSQVSVLKESVDDQDEKEQLAKIQRSLAEIDRRLP